MGQTTWTPVYFIAQLFYFIALVRPAYIYTRMCRKNFFFSIHSGLTQPLRCACIALRLQVRIQIWVRGRFGNKKVKMIQNPHV